MSNPFFEFSIILSDFGSFFLPASRDTRLSPPLIQICVLRTPFFPQYVRDLSFHFGNCCWYLLFLVQTSFRHRQRSLAMDVYSSSRIVASAPATPPPEPKVVLEADVVVECLATPRLEASRPIVRQGLALDGWSLERTSASFSSQKEHRQTLAVDDEDVKTVAVDAGIRLRKV